MCSLVRPTPRGADDVGLQDLACPSMKSGLGSRHCHCQCPPNTHVRTTVVYVCPLCVLVRRPRLNPQHADIVVRVRLKTLMPRIPYAQKVLQQGMYDCARDVARCRLGGKVVLAAVFIAMLCAPEGTYIVLPALKRGSTTGLQICLTWRWCPAQGRKCVATVFREHPSALSNCSVSSDACGSLPVFDEHGKLLEYKVAMKPYALTCTPVVGRPAPLQMMGHWCLQSGGRRKRIWKC